MHNAVVLTVDARIVLEIMNISDSALSVLNWSAAGSLQRLEEGRRLSETECFQGVSRVTRRLLRRMRFERKK